MKAGFRSPRERDSNPSETVCRLCRRAFRAVTWTHLVNTHGFAQEGAVDAYKCRFQVDRVFSRDLLSLKSRIARRYYERVGRRWTKARIRGEIRSRASQGLALNHDAVARKAKPLENAALRNYGSWDAALRASGIAVPEARRARSWSRESLTRAIRKLNGEGAPVNAKAVEKADPGLHLSARRWFGSWDEALRASGIDPLAVRRSRVWSREDVIRAIRARPAMRSGEAFLRERKLWVAARKHFGSWNAAVQTALLPRRTSRLGPG